MSTRPVGHPKKKPPIRFVAATAVAVSDPRYKNDGSAPTVMNAVLIDHRGHAWHWDGITEKGSRIRMQPRDEKAIRTRRRSGAK